MTIALCHCGRPLHYKSADAKSMVDRTIQTLGEYTEVETPEGRWKVQRHYIALHGLKAKDLPGLGFEKIK